MTAVLLHAVSSDFTSPQSREGFLFKKNKTQEILFINASVVNSVWFKTNVGWKDK